MEGAVSLIPWAEKKVVKLGQTLGDKYEVMRRFQEYKQMQYWTKSSLRISTAFDWGHTCDLTQAIIEAANDILCTERPLCLAFTSRTLVSKALGMNIERDIWMLMVECSLQKASEFIFKPNQSHPADYDPQVLCLRYLEEEIHQDESEEREEREREREIQRLRGKKDKLTALRTKREEEFSKEETLNPGVKLGLHAFAIYYSLHERKKREHRKIDQRLVSEIQSIEVDIRRNEVKVSAVANARRKVANARRKVANDMVRLLESAYMLYHSNCSFERCCQKGECTTRKRARQLTSCQGMNVKLAPCSCNGRPKENHLMLAAGFKEIVTLWYRFIFNWDDIVRKASEGFRFPRYPGIGDLIFHDMATGFAASSAMLRRGAKYSDRDGTTIVHPGERAAVLSSSCQILEIKGSAVEKNGIRRQWGPAAAEFSEYALLRCALVRRSRMTFREAVNDWKSQYALWDRAPGTISEWIDGPRDGKETDDMKLILLRQALGTEPSIYIHASPNVECTAFGGYVSSKSESMEVIDRGADKTMVIDRPLKLKIGIQSHKKCKGMVNDAWGSTKRLLGAGNSSLKYVVRTGRPKIFRLVDYDSFPDEDEMKSDPEDKVMWIT